MMSLAHQLLISHFMGDLSSLTGRNTVGRGLLTLSGIFVLIAFILFLISVYLGFSTIYAHYVALALTGGAAMIFALFFAGCMHCYRLYSAWKLKRAQDDIARKLQDAMAYVDEELGDVIIKNPKLSLSMAGFMGAWIGNNFFRN